MTTNHPLDEQESGRVILSREEYDALQEAAEAHGRSAVQLRSLRETCNAQAKVLLEVDLRTTYLERVCGMQKVMLDMLRSDVPTIVSLETLSAFWQRWSIEVGNAKLPRDEVAAHEPDLFRRWRAHVLQAGKVDRSARSPAQRTRAEHEDAQPKTAAERTDDHVVRLREENRALEERLAKLTQEIDDYKRTYVVKR